MTQRIKPIGKANNLTGVLYNNIDTNKQGLENDHFQGQTMHCTYVFFLSLSLSLRMLLAFILIPVLQKQLDSFRNTIWNTHRIRTQKNTCLPDGVSDHIYNFPEQYGLEECGY